ncbi:MAG: hypothetical protein KGS72_23415 [Cyanobacteria bacterium REEB67]|nr:hypothetical protein [Cyanobacteria bacterium REEB67]
MNFLPSKIAFCVLVKRGPDTRSEGYIVNTDGSDLVRIDDSAVKARITNNFSVTSPAWNSDGEYVDFAISPSDGSVLSDDFTLRYLVSAKKSTIIEKEVEIIEPEASYSPDGKFVALMVDDAEENGFILKNCSTGDSTIIGEELPEISNFLWSPDSSKLLFAATNSNYRNDAWCLELLSHQTSKVVSNLPDEPVWSWAPDSTRIIIAADDPSGEIGWCFYLRNFQDDHLIEILTQEDSTLELFAEMPVWTSEGSFFALANKTSEEVDDYSINIYSKQGVLVKTLVWSSANFVLITNMAFAPK